MYTEDDTRVHGILQNGNNVGLKIWEFAVDARYVAAVDAGGARRSPDSAPLRVNLQSETSRPRVQIQLRT